MKGKKSIGFKPKKKAKKVLRLSIKKIKKKIQKTLDKLILKVKQLKKNISKPKKDVYKPRKISGAFSDNFVEQQSNGNRDRSISIARYLNNIREHLRKLINDKKKSGEWKIQLIMKINFISSRDFIESRDMYSKSDNFEIMRGSNTNEIIRDLLILFCEDIKEVYMNQ